VVKKGVRALFVLNIILAAPRIHLHVCIGKNGLGREEKLLRACYLS